MHSGVYLGLVLLAATPAWSQVGSIPFEMATTPIEETRMLTPPPVSGQTYPTIVGSEMRSNYLGAGVVLNTAYNDNVLAGGNNTPVDDVIYSIWPTIQLDQTTLRQHRTFTFSPGFTLYQHTSTLNGADQSASVDFQYRLSEHVTISLSDTFLKISNIFNQPFGGGISGSPLPPPAGIVAPFADQLSNTANVGMSYQFGRNSMVGGSGIATDIHYPNPAQALGINDSNSRGGLAFYSQRLSNSQYVGVTYQYLRSQTNPVSAQATPLNIGIEVQTHTALPFYTLYFSPTLSFSLSGGPQYVGSTQSGSQPFRTWTPAAMASIARQTNRTNFVASYSRTVTGGSGLLGTFLSNSANGSLRLQIARTWTVGSDVTYSNERNITPYFISSNPGGHTISGTVSLQHSMSGHLNAAIGYNRLHQSYSGVAVISNAPDSNREYVSISYQFTRSLGR
jgi:hypothetical protein